MSFHFRPMVSVLMPCRAGQESVVDAVASVRAQSFEDWELVIAQDGTIDDVTRYLGNAIYDPRVKILDPVAYGSAARARNGALARAQGRLVAFLDADDLWLPEKLDKQVTEMRRRKTAFCCSAYFVEKLGGKTIRRTPPETMTLQTLLRGNRVGCLTAIYDARQLGKQPMPDIKMRHDYALWLRLLSQTETCVGLPEVLAVHRRNPGSLSSNAFEATAATWSMLRTEAGLGYLGAGKTVLSHSIGRLMRG
ncbi:MAG: glycosyltransferase family A protein [Pseudomonadota bacterium]